MALELESEVSLALPAALGRSRHMCGEADSARDKREVLKLAYLGEKVGKGGQDELTNRASALILLSIH